MSLLEFDEWRCAIIDAPLEEIIKARSFEGMKVTFLPDEGSYRFLADPFGLWHDDKLYVFAEFYNYRQGKGVIDVLIYSKNFRLLERKQVLEEAWHLSYPYVFEHEGQFYMLPEGYKSGRLSLYRARQFPYEWERIEAFDFPRAAIDATPLYHAGRWWLFWTPSEPREIRKSGLHLAIAEDLEGPWADIGCILVDKSGARPGGTPVIIENEVYLPVQNCTKTYGGGLRFLRFTGFEYGKPKVESLPELDIASSLKTFYADGMHTLSSAGPVTLIDVKRRRSGIRHAFYTLRQRAAVFLASRKKKD